MVSVTIKVWNLERGRTLVSGRPINLCFPFHVTLLTETRYEEIHKPLDGEDGHPEVQWGGVNRFLFRDKQVSDEWEHLERIANMIDHENDALLYVNSDNPFSRKMANAILKWGRKAVNFTYDVYRSDKVA